MSEIERQLAAVRDSIRKSAESTDDPFEAFNKAQGMGTVRDPYPIFAGMRAAAPVHKIDTEAMLGGVGDAPAAGPPGASLMAPSGDLWFAVSYDAVEEVLRDDERFNSSGYGQIMGPVMGRAILLMDGAEHTQHRNLINRAFSRRSLERWEKELVRPVVEAYVDQFCENGSADLVRDLTFPFPVRVIARMLGVPDEDFRDFHRWAIELISVMLDYDNALEASGKLGDLFRRLIAGRRAQPTGDLISVLVNAKVDGEQLDDEAILAFARLLAPAGAETTYRSSSNLLFGLLSNPDQLDAIRKDRSLIPQCIEEGVRWEPPLLTIMRTATRDTEICGVPITEGGSIILNMGAANRDPAYWDEPDRFDIYRKQRQHMSFAFGRHLCMGQHLARMETRVVLEVLLDRLPDLRLDPDAEDVHITGMVFRAPLALPVCFTPSIAH